MINLVIFMEELIDKYFDELIKIDEFQELLKLKDIIMDKYKNLIIGFRTKESIYLDMKRFEGTEEFNKVKKDFMLAKKSLYEKEEIKRYFYLENKIQEIIDNDINEIKSVISDDFKINVHKTCGLLKK